ncbi:DUF4132 domain-containing protein [Filimonas effusa]|uniref:DUF4132 domain-containing protein n=1 Tax=Filimonas effusa TaxID=2508721 RepID=A0A4Q1D824_9BACT|nr:DUF4132 domain-containing protein [Filimonas effusa]RXK85464.1 DUF4132 domain-containing protein [Filimonas effusa]
MNFLKKIKNVFSDTTTDEKEFKQAVHDTWKEYRTKREYFWGCNLNDTTTWPQIVKTWPDNKKVAFALWLVTAISHFMSGRRTGSNADEASQKNAVQQAYLQALMRNKLLLEEDDVVRLFNAFSQYKANDWSYLTTWPVASLLNQVVKQWKDKPFSPVLEDALRQLKELLDKYMSPYDQKEHIKMVGKIDGMLFKNTNASSAVKPVKFMGNDPLAEFANLSLERMPGNEKLVWYQILALAQKVSGAKPSQKYLNEIKTLIKALGADKFKKTTHDWFHFLIELKEREETHSYTYSSGYEYNYSSYDYITSVNADLIKGLVWACAHFHDGASIQTISALAERAFKKIPGKGPTAAAIGNACLFTLFASKGLDGIGQLSRLRLRIKQGSTQALIDKYLASAAGEKGVSVSEIEDMAVDDAGMQHGNKTISFDDYTAVVNITGIGKTELNWIKPDGAPQKSVPAHIKDKHAARLKKLKDNIKLAEQTLVTQRDRIDRMLREDRRMSKEHFHTYYLQHGIMSFIAERLIWNFHAADNTIRQAICLNDQWMNQHKEPLDITTATEVSLWHPVQASVETIKSWREFLVAHQLQQPLKQAFREIYLLTEAEFTTKTYSNRMAAHLLRQHQFNSLAKSRNWRYTLMGAFDNGMDNGIASLSLPAYNLRAEYWINEVNAVDATNDTGIWNYISTDQVRFLDTLSGNLVDLVEIPAQVFSEVMRDVDLFVGVASVGNDPTWQDSGGLPAYRDYWTAYSFGELSEVAKNRKDILANLVPRLKIGPVATIRDKFLVVKGKLRTYKIHIGSTNILMEPNDQYLCIVPDRSQQNPAEKIFLPFEGDNGLSVILSKAFLLAEDDVITDPTITSQIKLK